MKQSEKLRKNYEFRFVLTKGQYYSGRVIEAFAVKNNLKINKVGIAVRKKIGKAVKRNRIKRLIRETYRINKEGLIQGRSIVFLVKKNIDVKTISFNDINEDMKKILFRIGQEK